MKKVLPIGSVVEARGLKLCLLGIRMAEKEGRLAAAYCAVPYPRGFAGADSLGMIWEDEITKVLFTGAEGTAGKRFYDGLGEIYAELEGKTAAEAAELTDLSDCLEYLKTSAGRKE